MLQQYVYENPWPLIYGLAGLCVIALIAFKITQLAKYLGVALGGLGLAGLLLAIDWWVITDSEKVGGIVYDMADAVQKSDVDRVLNHLDLPQSKNPVFNFLNDVVKSDFVKERIKASLSDYQFDFVKIGGLKVEVYPQSRRAKAEFKAFASAMAKHPGAGATMGAGTFNSGWVLSFQETQPGVWKVVSITSTGDTSGSDEIARYLGIKSK